MKILANLVQFPKDFMTRPVLYSQCVKIPIIGTGSNLDSYSSALAADENLNQLRGMAEGIDLNSKDNVKNSNSFLRYL